MQQVDPSPSAPSGAERSSLRSLCLVAVLAVVGLLRGSSLAQEVRGESDPSAVLEATAARQSDGLPEGQVEHPNEPHDERLRGIDLEGNLHVLQHAHGTKGVVLVWLTTDCPISNGLIPKLADLRQKYLSSGVDWYGVISSPGVTRSQARDHQAEFQIPFPVLFDSAHDLRRRLGPTHTPQAVLLSSTGDILYSGSIDDQFRDLGRKQASPDREYLVEAIEACLRGKQPAVPYVEPVGCLLEDDPVLVADSHRNNDQEKDPASVTYSRDVAPLIQAHCVACHRPGQSAPFSLRTYDEVSRHAKQIVEVTQSRYMPPWKPVHGHGRFRGERRLEQAEIARLASWVAQGKPEGDVADLPPPPKFHDRWLMGPPDMVLSMREAFSVPASGADIHQHFVIPMRLKEDRLVAAIEFHPGKASVVHHASFYLDTERGGRALDDASPEIYGYGGPGGPGFLNEGSLRSWLVGMTPEKLPDGMGRIVRRGSDLVMEVHYRPRGKEEVDRSEVGLYFAPRSARHAVTEVQVSDKSLVIPAGAKRHHHQSKFTLPVATTLLDCAPHMHFLGKAMRAHAQLPDGRILPLIYVDDWDFNWQGQYVYEDPIQLPEGTQLIVDAWYDNSAENPLNPNSPPRTVYWGEQSSDEMDICHFQCTCEDAERILKLSSAINSYYGEQNRLHRDTLTAAGQTLPAHLREPSDKKRREFR